MPADTATTHPRPAHPAASIDTLGLFCPVPILRTARRMRAMEPGELLEVLSDDPVILEDMPAWCLSNGHDYLGAEARGEHWRLLVRKR